VSFGSSPKVSSDTKYFCHDELEQHYQVERNYNSELVAMQLQLSVEACTPLVRRHTATVGMEALQRSGGHCVLCGRVEGMALDAGRDHISHSGGKAAWRL
jgi:hypothetical protein